MFPLFDIFVIEPDGSTRWCEAADSLESAKALVKALAQSTPAQYIIFNKKTGHRTILGSSEPLPELPKAPVSSRQPRYHICRVEKEKLRWVEAAETVHVAEARIKVLKAFQPGDYLVLDYNPEQSDSPPPWTTLSFVFSSFSL